MHVHQFWYGATLPHLARMSAQSFVKHGHAVTLWSYDAYTLPPGVERGDATLIWPRDVFDLLCARFSTMFDRHRAIAAASDYFRMRLLQHVLLEFDDVAVWADSDTLCLKPLPTPGSSGAIFSTVPARQTGPFAPNPDPITGRREYFSLGLMILDRRALVFVKKAIHKLENFKAHRKYTDAMTVVDRVRRKMQLTDIYPPIAFCPIPPFALDRAIKINSCNGFEMYGTVCPSIHDIVKHSFVVHLYGSHGYEPTHKELWPTTSLLRCLPC